MRLAFRAFKSSQKPRRKLSRNRLATESLEARLALDAALPNTEPLDAGHYAAEATDGEALRFYLSEAGIGEGPVVENPTIHMELGETKTLNIWMQVPRDVRLNGAGLSLVSDVSGVVSAATSAIYESQPGDRWLSNASYSNVVSGRTGDVLAQLAPFAISPPRFHSTLFKSNDLSYDSATESFLFGTVTITAENAGSSNLFFEVGRFKIVAAGPGGGEIPVHFGVNDGSVLSTTPFATTSLADAQIVVTGPITTAVPQADVYEFQAVASSVHEVSASQGLLANDSAPSGAIVQLVSAPRLGTVELADDGSFRYSAPSMSRLHPTWRNHAAIDDGFSYRIVTSSGESSVGRVDLHLVASVEANDDYFTLDLHEAGAYNVWEQNFLCDDPYFSQAPHLLTWRFTSEPQHGSMSIYQDIWHWYTPDPGFIGRDSIEYEYTDGTTTATATIYIDVTNSNRAPVAADDAFAVAGLSRYINGSDLLANDTDPDGDDLYASDIRIIDLPQNGSVEYGPFGSLIYTPSGGFRGTDTFTYVVKDRFHESLPVMVSMTVPAIVTDPDDDDDSDDWSNGPGGEVFAPPAAAPTPIHQANRDRDDSRDDRGPRERDRTPLVATRPRATARRAAIDPAAADQQYASGILAAGTRENRLLGRRGLRT